MILIIIGLTFLFGALVLTYLVRCRRYCDLLFISPPPSPSPPSPSPPSPSPPSPSPPSPSPPLTQEEFKAILSERVYILTGPLPIKETGNTNAFWTKLGDILVEDEGRATLGGGYSVEWDSTTKMFKLETEYNGNIYPSTLSGFWNTDTQSDGFQVLFGEGPGTLGNGIPFPSYQKTDLPISDGFIIFDFNNVDFQNQYVYIAFSDGTLP